MADYPTTIITPTTYIDKGEQVTELNRIITAQGQIILEHYAKGRELLTDGRIQNSTISVTQSGGGQVFTEIFSTPVPEGPYFYHYRNTSLDTSVLLFSTSLATTGITYDVIYTASGDVIRAAKLNTIQNDLAAIETILGAGNLGMQSGTIESPTSPQDIAIVTADPLLGASVIPFFSAPTGLGTMTYAITLGASAKVTVTDAPDDLNYLFILKT